MQAIFKNLHPSGPPHDCPRLQYPTVGRNSSLNKFFDLDRRGEAIDGLASGFVVPFPHQDDRFICKFDNRYYSEFLRKQELAEYYQQRREQRQQVMDTEDSEEEPRETYADVFVAYMNKFDFDERDMLNPEEKVEYSAYLKNLEKTISQKLEHPINIYGNIKSSPSKYSQTIQQPQYKRLRLCIISLHSQYQDVHMRLGTQRKPLWNSSSKPHPDNSTATLPNSIPVASLQGSTTAIGDGQLANNEGDSKNLKGYKKIQHRGDVLLISTTSAQVPHDFSALLQRHMASNPTGASEVAALRSSAERSSRRRLPGQNDPVSYPRDDQADSSRQPPIIPRKRELPEHHRPELKPGFAPKITGDLITDHKIYIRKEIDQLIVDQNSKPNQWPLGVQLVINEPQGTIGGIKYRDVTEAERGLRSKKNSMPSSIRDGDKDKSIKKQIATKTKEMQKLVKEEEYFKNITYDQIEKKIQFMEKAMGYPNTQNESKDRLDNVEPRGMGSVTRSFQKSRKSWKRQKSASKKSGMSGQKRRKNNAKQGQLQNELNIDDVQKLHGNIYIDLQDSYSQESSFPHHLQSRKVPMPSQGGHDIGKSVGGSSLTYSECRKQIQNLQNGYSQLRQSAMDARDDGKTYFHQEFEEEVENLRSSRLERQQERYRHGKSHKVPNMANKIRNQPEEEEDTNVSASPRHHRHVKQGMSPPLIVGSVIGRKSLDAEFNKVQMQIINQGAGTMQSSQNTSQVGKPSAFAQSLRQGTLIQDMVFLESQQHQHQQNLQQQQHVHPKMRVPSEQSKMTTPIEPPQNRPLTKTTRKKEKKQSQGVPESYLKNKAKAENIRRFREFKEEIKQSQQSQLRNYEQESNKLLPNIGGDYHHNAITPSQKGGIDIFRIRNEGPFSGKHRNPIPGDTMTIPMSAGGSPKSDAQPLRKPVVFDGETLPGSTQGNKKMKLQQRHPPPLKQAEYFGNPKHGHPSSLHYQPSSGHNQPPRGRENGSKLHDYAYEQESSIKDFHRMLQGMDGAPGEQVSILAAGPAPHDPDLERLTGREFKSHKSDIRALPIDQQEVFGRESLMSKTGQPGQLAEQLLSSTFGKQPATKKKKQESFAQHVKESLKMSMGDASIREPETQNKTSLKQIFMRRLSNQALKAANNQPRFVQVAAKRKFKNYNNYSYLQGNQKGPKNLKLQGVKQEIHSPKENKGRSPITSKEPIGFASFSSPHEENSFAVQKEPRQDSETILPKQGKPGRGHRVLPKLNTSFGGATMTKKQTIGAVGATGASSTKRTFQQQRNTSSTLVAHHTGKLIMNINSQFPGADVAATPNEQHLDQKTPRDFERLTSMEKMDQENATVALLESPPKRSTDRKLRLKSQKGDYEVEATQVQKSNEFANVSNRKEQKMKHDALIQSIIESSNLRQSIQDKNLKKKLASICGKNALKTYEGKVGIKESIGGSAGRTTFRANNKKVFEIYKNSNTTNFQPSAAKARAIVNQNSKQKLSQAMLYPDIGPVGPYIPNSQIMTPKSRRKHPQQSDEDSLMKMPPFNLPTAATGANFYSNQASTTWYGSLFPPNGGSGQVQSVPIEPPESTNYGRTQSIPVEEAGAYRQSPQLNNKHRELITNIEAKLKYYQGKQNQQYQQKELEKQKKIGALPRPDPVSSILNQKAYI